ncbi:hypothetical protein [Streptomyces sp. NPDC048650]|uniref:hypothetical protein n=1 Tax=Streptomyces sp. NPDC048650 TaxID=3365583 RepID=UPI00371E2547
MTSSPPPIQIHVLSPDEQDDEVPLTDVGVVNINGERHLFLSPQSFYSAVRQVSSAMPDLPMEQVELLVREHCGFKDFDELLGPPVDSAPPVDLPPPPQEPTASVRPSGRRKKWVVAAALLPAFAGAWALGHFTGADPVSSAASAPDAGPNTASDKTTNDNQNLGPAPFTAQDFMDFSDAGKIDCSPIDDLEAECTDSDGMVMATKAATGPDSTIFTFSYGSERIGLRIFGTAEYAKTWTQQDGSRELYPNMSRSGRYVLWGTDKARLKEYKELLEAAPKPGAVAQTLAHTMGSTEPLPPRLAAPTLGSTEPLPPRLAALALGTLGLDEQDVRTILFTPQDAPVETPVLMAAQAVLGTSDTGASAVEPGAADIVALAAGLEPRPDVAGTEPDAHSGVADVVDPAPSSGGSSGESTATAASDPSPAPDPKPMESGQTQESVEEKPKEPKETEKPTAPEPTPDPTPKPEEPERKPEQPTEPGTPPTAPADPAPVDPDPPVAETPTPQDPGTAGKQSPEDDGDGAAEELPATGGQTSSDGHVVQADGDAELLVLPQAWIAPAA